MLEKCLKTITNEGYLSIKTVADCDQGRNNNYLLLRFIAATIVILYHSYPLCCGNHRDPLFILTGHTNLGAIAVHIFFIVSGYLITKSFISRNSLITYLVARVLRIFPAIIVAVIFTVFIIGGLNTTIPLRHYLISDEVLAYIANNVTLIKIQYSLPGVFLDNPYSGSVNGSLWTLPAELRMYFLVGLMGAIGLMRRRYIFNIAIISAVILYFLFPDLFIIFKGHESYPRLAAYFVFGAFCYINRDIFPLNTVIVVFLIVASIFLHGTAYFPFSFIALLCYGVFWFAYYPSKWLQKFNRFGDYSYGIYIYAFPIQQTIVSMSGSKSPFYIFLLSFLMTLPLAILSYHLIEKPAMEIKNKPFVSRFLLVKSQDICQEK